ncbi:nicotinamide riboside transporter PnuC [Corynebacterium pelargi]|uniref:Nicotinamide mononucleotide transporter n=1 Tax=Corynebacterium pelargi TaxID=1471400 RepID=A0A410W9W5_9CORY|nr:nicotinamide riboside transporter PnuC [Corynebacterium pelargi]QAU52739.1 Nicotinamide mononucleotide transporter [Corynebacterium pelargi]GGG78477.1 nicotinamide mononucleotide transporter [Corynebacterium pelargi]
MGVLNSLLEATLLIGGVPILWREIIGNLFGLASAYGGMKRVVWAWPVGIIGNLLLFTVFLGGVFNTPQNLDLYGQAGRQVMFLCVSLYGWWQWSAAKRRGLRECQDVDPSRSIVSEPAAVQPHWASKRQRLGMAVFAIIATVVFAAIFQALGSWGPWADAWIFVGSMLATFGMAKGWTEFWLIWIAVDIVGVPLLLSAGYYPSAALYVFYGAFVLWGFVTWLKVQRQQDSQETPSARSALSSHNA